MKAVLMKALLRFFLPGIFLLAAAIAWGQCPDGNCSTADMELTGSTNECQRPQNPLPLSPYPAGGTTTYLDTATSANGVYYSQSAPQTVPMVANSNPGEDGQCAEYAGNWTVCPGIWQTQVVEVIDPDSGTDVWQFYNRGYGAVLAGSWPYTCEKGADFYGQNFQQVNVTCCNPKTNPCCATSNCADPADQCNSNYCTCSQTSPIIIDTTGHGYHLTSAEDGAMFDLFGDGTPMKIAWTAASSTDAFLALPVDGQIHNGRELFGNVTTQTCKGPDRNGYCALGEWDKPENGGNGDGIIDSRDAVFPRLRLWIDSNHDGISQAQELHTLPELGVFSISLHYHESRRTDEFGNKFRFTARINVTDTGEQSKDAKVTYDVFLLALPKSSCRVAKQKTEAKTQ